MDNCLSSQGKVNEGDLRTIQGSKVYFTFTEVRARSMSKPLQQQKAINLSLTLSSQIAEIRTKSQ